MVICVLNFYISSNTETSALVMSQIFTLTGRSSTLSIDFVNPIELDAHSYYGLALIGFYSYNSIPNIEAANNKFYYVDNHQTKKIIIPVGSYEIDNIELSTEIISLRSY